MILNIQKDHTRFRKIVRGKIRENLKKYRKMEVPAVLGLVQAVRTPLSPPRRDSIIDWRTSRA